MRNNYFIEGLQGAGKTTLVRTLSALLPDHKVFREGDYSPVELAWCAYVTKEQYDVILTEYAPLAKEIGQKTFIEGERRIICYTQILTDIPKFHKNLEKFEIYNGNLDKDAFESVILERFGRWDGEGQIFECSFFQNIIENQMLYLMMTDEEIIDFYRKLKSVLEVKPYRIIYLDVADIRGAVDVIRKERSDDNGNELWFPMMTAFVEASPYGKKHGLTGLEGLLSHLERRRALEHRIIDGVFAENTTVLKSKDYKPEEILA